MSEPSEEELPLDLSSLEVTDAPLPSEPHGTPDHTASRTNSRARQWAQQFKDGKEQAAADKPRRGRPPATRKSVPRRKGMFVAPLTQLYVASGAFLMPFDPVCANAVIQSADNCARTLDDLAYQNDAVRRALYALTQTSASTAVIIAHLPILMAITIHHVPSVQQYMGKMGEEMAEKIAAQMQANMPPEDGSV